MISIIQAKSKLPIDFIENIYKDFPTRTADKILEGLSQKRYTTLRVNTLKYTSRELIELLERKKIDYEKVNWYEEAFIIKNFNEKEIQKLEIYNEGKIYLQSLSSMLPPLILEPKEGEKVLDLTAAPGSKTTQMAMMMKNKGYILANELNKIRYEKLQYNIKVQGIKIAKVINEKGQEVGNEYPEFFDKILLDTPCSGEGRFSIDEPKSYLNWSSKLVKDLTIIQKELFESAVKSLKSNGILVYSTCTLNKKENEEILDWALKNFNLEMLEINMKNSLKIKNFLNANSKGLEKTIDRAIKILPSKEMEGFFVAKLKKK